MTLKEQLEILRGEPIDVYDGNPLEIPCIETSDAEKLCKHPVVSVNMITYNHEPYIRQAIEGVMMQQTDFEFELVIGEDASQDKTREICFEYQKKYPDKIRVLWSEQNVYHLGGNSRRVTARCRGEFIAFCEGDDYWIDPLKLQKQVDLIREHNAVGCVAFNHILYNDGRIADNVYLKKMYITNTDYSKHYFHTSTYLFRHDVFKEIHKQYRLPYWYDTMMFQCMAAHGLIVLLPEIVSVRRFTTLGVATSLNREGFFILNLNQSLAMYLWGPKKLKSLYATSILNTISLAFISKEAFNREFYDKKRKALVAIFYQLFVRHIFRFKAWFFLLRIVVYRVGLKQLKCN